MFTRGRAITVAGVLAAALAVHGIGAAALSAASSVVFFGLPHTAIGNALLRVDTSRNVLEVQPLDAGGGDGVRVGLPDTTSWTARMSASEAVGAPLSVNWDAVADGRAISSASMLRAGSRFDLRAKFTGGVKPTYSAQVYNAGQLVGSVGGVPSSAGHIYIPVSWCSVFSDLFDCGFTTEFHNSANSQCEWRFVFRTSIPMTLPNGAVATGNELRLVEEVKPAGHYPYLKYNDVIIRSNTRLLTLFSETFR